MDKNLILREKILTEPIFKQAVKNSWPVVVAMVLMGLNGFLDVVFVGRFASREALDGITYAFPVYQLLTNFAALLGTGAASVLSIAIGANDEKIKNKLLGNLNVLIIILSVVMTVLFTALSPYMSSALGAIGDAKKYADQYLIRVSSFTLFLTIGLSGNFLIRGEGKMKMAALLMGIGVVVNVIFNAIFMVGLKMGIKGAAWGTNISVVAYSLTFVFYILSKKATFKSKLFSFNIDKEIIKNIIKLGFPSIIPTVMYFIQQIVMLNVLTKYGPENEIGFLGTLTRIFMLILTPVFGIMRTYQTFAGINFGDKKYLRIIKGFKLFSLYAMILILPLYLVVMIWPQSVLQLAFSSTSITASQIFITRIYFMVLPTLPIIFIAMTFFPSINKPNPSSILLLARQIVFYIPLMLTTPRFLGYKWLYYNTAIIDGTVVLISLIFLFKEFKNLKNGKVKLLTK